MQFEPEIEYSLVKTFLVCLGRRLIMKFEVVVSEGRQDNCIWHVLSGQKTEVTVNIQQSLI